MIFDKMISETKEVLMIFPSQYNFDCEKLGLDKIDHIFPQSKQDLYRNLRYIYTTPTQDLFNTSLNNDDNPLLKLTSIPFSHYQNELEVINRWTRRHIQEMDFPNANFSKMEKLFESTVEKAQTSEIDRAMLKILPFVTPSIVKRWVWKSEFENVLTKMSEIKQFPELEVYEKLNQLKVAYKLNHTQSTASEFDKSKKPLNTYSQKDTIESRNGESRKRVVANHSSRVELNNNNKEEVMTTPSHKPENAEGAKEKGNQNRFKYKDKNESSIPDTETRDAFVDKFIYFIHGQLDSTPVNEVSQYSFSKNIVNKLKEIQKSSGLSEPEIITKLIVPLISSFDNKGLEKFFALWKPIEDNKIKVNEDLIRYGQFWKQLSQLPSRDVVTKHLPKMIMFNRGSEKIFQEVYNSLSLITQDEEKFKERIQFFSEMGVSLDQKSKVVIEKGKNGKIQIAEVSEIEKDKKGEVVSLKDLLLSNDNPMWVKAIKGTDEYRNIPPLFKRR